jgi:hypothetical protein
MRLVALSALALAACGGIATIDGDGDESGGTGAASSASTSTTTTTSSATSTTASSASGTTACGSEEPVGAIEECFRAWNGPGTPCVSEVCDDGVSFWRSVCAGTSCDCYLDNTVQPKCSCTRAAADACPSPTCCPDPWQG